MATDFPDQANENVFSGKSREPPLFDECELATTSRVPTFNGHLSIGEVLCIGISKNEHFFDLILRDFSEPLFDALGLHLGSRNTSKMSPKRGPKLKHEIH